MDVKTAIETGDVIALRQLLREDPARANALVHWGKRCEIRTEPLHYVSDMLFDGTLDPAKALPLVDALVAAGANVNYQKPGHGETPLIGAASLGAEHVGLRLLDAGAQPNLLGLFGESALHWAAMLGADRLVGGLLDKGAFVNKKDDKYESTPLGWALHGWAQPQQGAAGRHLDVVERLVAAGAHVDASMLNSPEVLASPAMRSALQAGRAR